MSGNDKRNELKSISSTMEKQQTKNSIEMTIKRKEIVWNKHCFASSSQLYFSRVGIEQNSLSKKKTNAS